MEKKTSPNGQMVGLFYLLRIICALRFCCVCGGEVILTFGVPCSHQQFHAHGNSKPLLKLALKTKRTMVDRSAQYRLS